MAALQAFGSPFNMAPTICRCGGISHESMEWGLPIALRGNFFHDSFFKNVRSNFDAAVQDMLSKWGQMDMLSDVHHTTTSPLVNNFSLYRQLKSRANQEENHASTIVSDNRNHKVVIDVHDFMDGDIKVNVLGENEVLVEGRSNANSSDGSSVSSKAFSRRFNFPNSVNMADITSVMSSDGIMTIEAPNLERKDGSTVKQIKIETESSSTNSTSKDAISSVVAGSAGDISQCEDTKDTVYYCKGCNKQIGAWHNAPETKIAQEKGTKVPIKIGTSMSRPNQSIPVTHDSPYELRQNVQSSNLNINEQNQTLNQQEKKTIANISSLEGKTHDTSRDVQIQSTNKNTFDVPVTAQFNFLPIIKRGPFFSDTFFHDIQREFHSAVQDVLSRWENRPSFIEDDFSAYRNLRLCDLKEETQAAKCVEDDLSHKFVLDVQDFINGGEVTVKAVNDREIVIEGHIERGEGGARSVKRFLKRFNVPGNIKLDSVTSVMSSDGVLTITAPKKPSTVQLREIDIPVSIEGSKEKNLKITSSTEAAESSKVNKLAHQSNTNQYSMTNQNTSSNEHIIPIDVEGRNTKEGGISNKSETKFQNSVNTRQSVNTQHMMQQSQGNATKEHIIPVTVEGSANESLTRDLSREVKVEKEKECQQTNKTEQVVHKNHENAKNEHIIPVNVVGNQLSKQQQTQQSQEKTNQQSSSNAGKVQIKSIENASDSAFKHNVYQFAHQNQQKYNDNLSGISTKRYLPITRRGIFFDDSFFQNYHNNFQTAVRNVLIKSRQHVDQSDNMSVYRGLRQRDLKVENQALHVQEDNESLKIVVDAKDFINGDITVCIDGEELVIEGRAENSEAKSSNSLTFSHRFLLPEFADISTITSAISSDGILTVNSPKSGNASDAAVKRMSSEARSKHESHTDGGHKMEEKRVKESSEKSADGTSSRRLSTSSFSAQQQTYSF